MFQIIRPSYFGRSQAREIINKSSNESRDLDPPPTWFLKKCLDQLQYRATSIINRPMAQSVMMLYLGSAVITPLIKRCGLAKDDMKNYCPISNLQILAVRQ